ncbi:hypothetical protein C8Q70DRAFT_709690 [Cubamyces menziesii]|nr:hypothetical protein C8Q70DRAFT_709690 [Cubamyces menziesii]
MLGNASCALHWLRSRSNNEAVRSAGRTYLLFISDHWNLCHCPIDSQSRTRPRGRSILWNAYHSAKLASSPLCACSGNVQVRSLPSKSTSTTIAVCEVRTLCERLH